MPKGPRALLWLRARLGLICLVSLSLGCGDCVQVQDFVDFTDVAYDFGNDAGLDDASNSPDADVDPGDAGEEKDFGLFDFGFDDTDIEPAPFSISAVVPNSGPVGGGTLVRIDGTGLLDDATVFFGSQAVEGTLSRGKIVARTPAGSGPGPVSVRVIHPDGDSRVLVDAFTYVTGLVVTEITPNRVPTTGGVEVELVGKGFEPETAVSVAGDSALRVRFVSDERIRVVVPPRPRGYADVRVTTRYATALVPRGLEYFAPLALHNVNPATGSVAGGETVVLTGAGFDANLRASFGGVAAEVLNVNVAQQAAQVRVPPHAAGLVDVQVTNLTDASALEDAYFYAADANPALAGLRPTSGPSSGGNEVVLVGNGLNAAGATFSFGGAAATVISQTESLVTVRAPAGTGLGDVAFGINGTEVTRLVDAYRWITTLEASGLSPAQGDVEGGTLVTLRGTGLAGASVTVDGMPAEVVSSTDTEIVVRMPAHAAGSADVTISRDGLSDTLVDAFTYVEPLEVWGFSPVRGSVAGGTFVQVRGRGFSGELSATFGGRAATDVRRLDRNNLTVLTPAHPEADVDVVVANPVTNAKAPFTYSYFNPASRLGGASGGPVDGSVNVTVYSLGGGPLEDAFVMLSTRRDTPYQGMTDVNGMITLSGPDVLGAQTTTATKAGFSTASIQTVDAENITVFLNLLDPPPNPGGGTFPPSAAIWGDVSATGKLSDPDNEKTYDMAIVGTTTRTMFAANPSAGPNAIVLGEGRYEINTRIGDMAVVGLCGEFNSETQVFTPKLMAVKRFVYANDLDRQRHDLVCNIPLDQTLSFKLTNTDYTPTGPNNNRVDVFWDFGFEGVFKSPIQGVSLADIVQVTNQPAPAGDIADIRFRAVGGSYTNQGAPFSRSFVEAFDFTQQLTHVPTLLDVPILLDPQDGARVEGNIIRFAGGGPYYPDMYYLVLRNDSGIPVWQWLVPGTQNFALLPDFPDFSSLPADLRPNPYPSGALYLSIFAVRTTAGFVFEAVSYRDIQTESWRAYSLYPTSIQLP